MLQGLTKRAPDPEPPDARIYAPPRFFDRVQEGPGKWRGAVAVSKDAGRSDTNGSSGLHGFVGGLTVWTSMTLCSGFSMPTKASIPKCSAILLPLSATVEPPF